MGRHPAVSCTIGRQMMKPWRQRWELWMALSWPPPFLFGQMLQLSKTEGIAGSFRWLLSPQAACRFSGIAQHRGQNIAWSTGVGYQSHGLNLDQGPCGGSHVSGHISQCLLVLVYPAHSPCCWPDDSGRSLLEMQWGTSLGCYLCVRSAFENQ